MFLVIVGTKRKGCTDLVEALGEVAIQRTFRKVQLPPKLVIRDAGMPDLIEFTDRQVTALLLWLERRMMEY